MKTCKICKTKFEPQRPMQSLCGWACAAAQALNAGAKREAKRVKEDRKTTRVKLEKLKTRSTWMKEAQREFNLFIRTRDAGHPCICCGQPLGSGSVGGDFDCGHYRSVGSAPHLRFDERNAHGQRKQCNRWGAGRAVDYRAGLIARIGKEEVEALEADQTLKHYDISDLKAIKEKYKQKVRELKRNAV